MAHCCSQCDFTANFESALRMHQQLHHEASSGPVFPEAEASFPVDKSRTFPRIKSAPKRTPSSSGDYKVSHLGHTSSAHRLFDRLRTRLCGSRHALFSHPEVAASVERDLAGLGSDAINSDCTSKGGLLADSMNSMLGDRDTQSPTRFKETYGCHLCSYIADRITVLDRHLLNQHKIGLDNLLKLVLAKTKDGLSEQSDDLDLVTMNQPYYRAPADELQEEEFIQEIEMPKIKIMRNVATNTDLKWSDLPDLKDNCQIISDELEKIMASPSELADKNELLVKMKTLNDVMCKFADSTNTLKKVIAKESSKKSRHSVGHLGSIPEPLFNLGLGDQDSPRDWDRARSENYVRNRHRPDKLKMSSESFYF